MEPSPRRLRIYESPDERCPFEAWMDGLRDIRVPTIISNRLDRVEMGNLGDHKPVGDGVFELVFDFGPGYRVYYGEDGDTVVLLLGGEKKSQSQDIVKAKEYWRDYNA
jgi:putative addiction module killer protein